FNKVLLGAIALTATFTNLPAQAEQTKVLKFAILTPPGSSWTEEMNILNAHLKERTGGRLKLKLYPSGVMGDEIAVIRKLRQGQLQGAALTGLGLGEIATPVRLLELPFHYQDYATVDRVGARLKDRLAGEISKAGFVMLGWSETGFVYLFTNKPIHSLSDVADVKMWMWAGDPLAEESFKEMRVTPKPMAITDVMTSLQTGMVNGVYCPPLALLALQWQSKVKYMLDLKLTMSNSGITVTKKAWDELSPDLQQVLKEETLKTSAAIVRRSRIENEAAIVTLKRHGITVTSLTNPADQKNFLAASGRAADRLAGKLFSASMLKEVRSLVMR
ncbi:MAG TPA: TRAP transporter substrate-binding protein DctP, partial [Chroococcales cyanobacterium]